MRGPAVAALALALASLACGRYGPPTRSPAPAPEQAPAPQAPASEPAAPDPGGAEPREEEP